MWMGTGLAVVQPRRRSGGGGGGPPAATLPANTALPVISGTVQPGQTLTASTGAWTGTTPIAHAWQWQRGTGNIPGAVGASHVLQAADVGSTVRVVVTASNAAGAVSAPSAATGTVAEAALPAVTAITYAQSEIEFIFNPTGYYRQIPQPVPGDGNLIVFTQGVAGAAPVRTAVNPTTVAAGEVNPAVSSLSAFLQYVQPGRMFVVGDGAVPGTGRVNLHNDSDADGRRWSDFTSVIDAIQTEFGPVRNLIECWYGNDAAYISNFRNAFWPSYFGQNGGGTPYTLGTLNTVTGNVVATTLWDGNVAPSEKGRGIFRRDETRWHILTPMPYHDAPSLPAAELTQFSHAARLEEPRRQVMIDLADTAMAQSVGLKVGPSAHITYFNGGIHPEVDDPDGQWTLMEPIAVSLLRAAGMTVGEPVISGIEGPADGTYADLVVDLPNGGTLTTIRALRGQTVPTTSPHQQAVVGMEIARSGGARRPVFRTSETSYPAPHRGSVAITDPGSGSPRKGRVRITPETPFAANDALSYLRGQGSALLIKPRDVTARLYRDMLIEHVPGFYDASALYPFEGIAVRPYQQDIATPVPAPTSLVDFSAAPNRSTGGIEFTAVTDGWRVNFANTGMAFAWLTKGATAVVDTTWRFDLRVTGFTGTIRARVGMEVGLTSVRGASQDILFTDGVVQSLAVPVVPFVQATHIGLFVRTNTAPAVFEITNLRLTVG
jgi:hypothetical protein